MRTVKSKARKQNIGLTIPRATREARKIVDQVMPGVDMVTVDSRSSYRFDVGNVVITTITFPSMPVTDPRPWRMYAALESLAGFVPAAGTTADSSITIARTVRQ